LKQGLQQQFDRLRREIREDYRSMNQAQALGNAQEQLRQAQKKDRA